MEEILFQKWVELQKQLTDLVSDIMLVDWYISRLTGTIEKVTITDSRGMSVIRYIEDKDRPKQLKAEAKELQKRFEVLSAQERKAFNEYTMCKKEKQVALT